MAIQLDKETIKKLTKLSRIDCTPDEQESILNDLKKILVYFEQLEEIDTTNIRPYSHVMEDIVNVFREDIVEPTMSREDFLANAPSHIGGMIRVPPVIKSS